MRVVLDTNMLMEYGEDVFKKYDNIIIPLVLLEECDHLKTSDSETKAYKARRAIRLVEQYKDKIYIENKVGIAGLPISLHNNYTNDNEILSLCMDFCFNNENDIYLLTADVNMKHKARALHIPFIEWEDNNDEFYTGIKYIEIKDDDKCIEDIINRIDFSELIENQYVLIGIWEYNQEFEQNQFKLEKAYRYTHGILDNVRNPRLGEKLNDCFRDDAEAKLVYDAINCDDIDIIAITGLAGTGKNYSVLANCLNNVMQPIKNKKGSYKPKTILYTRSPIEVAGRKSGFLPGDIHEKNSPFFAPARQNIDKIFNVINIDKSYEDLIESKSYIEQPISIMRGMTFDNSYMVLDEASNTTAEEIQMFITRAGTDSKVIIIGSLAQIDEKGNSYTNNALYKVIEAYKGQKNFAAVTLNNQHRSYLSRQCDTLLSKYK